MCFLQTFNFTRCELMDWSGVHYLWIIVMFYQLFGPSFWRHPFTAEDPLVSKLCNAKFQQNFSCEETHSSTSWMPCGWVNFQRTFEFWGWIITSIDYISIIFLFFHLRTLGSTPEGQHQNKKWIEWNEVFAKKESCRYFSLVIAQISENVSPFYRQTSFIKDPSCQL